MLQMMSGETKSCLANKMLIWGTGRRANAFVQCMCEFYQSLTVRIPFLECIQGFIDSNPKKQEGLFCGKEVVPPNVLAHIEKDVIIVVAVADNVEIQGLLEEYDLVYGVDFFLDYDWIRYCRRDSKLKYTDGFIDDRLDKDNMPISLLYDWTFSSEPISEIQKYFKETTKADIVNTFVYYFIDDTSTLCKRILSSRINEIIPEKTKTIGIFLNEYGGGGAERVVSHIMPLYLKMGYRVILFTRMSSLHEYRVPDGVIHVRLSEIFNLLDPRDYLMELQEALTEYEIDTACFHIPYEGVDLFYGVLLARLMGIRTVIENHTSFINQIRQRGGLKRNVDVYQLCDRLVVLSRVDQTFWYDLGCRSTYIPNPCFVETANIPSKTKNNVPTVLWVGRINNKYKKIFDVVPIMKEVRKSIGTVRLLIVGAADDEKEEKLLLQKIHKYGLENTIKLCGRQEDMATFYLTSDVMLMTSPGEGFPMVLAEAKSYGLPVVMYDLPYLEMVRDKLGIITVGQGDRKAAADQIIHVITDDSIREKMSLEAKQSAIFFADYNLIEAWSNVLNGVYHDRDNTDIKIDRKLILQLLGER